MHAFGAGYFVAQLKRHALHCADMTADCACTALHCRQASYLVKQHVSFACKPPSGPAQMINFIQLCVAQQQLNPIILGYLLQLRLCHISQWVSSVVFEM